MNLDITATFFIVSVFLLIWIFFVHYVIRRKLLEYIDKWEIRQLNLMVGRGKVIGSLLENRDIHGLAKKDFDDYLKEEK
ncbi:hypothetical protein CCB80_10235 [Armatimonadetes bacterium Uphvl-Ar1]|nr:hypothetical protein CCB80_10235 [Armatimonadetes bacterium Uphvl-Ar1]